MKQLNGTARLAVLAGLTAVLLAQFLVWLPGPSAGLQFMGFELGEWIKFTGVGFERNYFYVPPITLGCMLALLTVGMENGRYQTWLLRGLGVAVSLLAFPAAAAILNEPPTEWLLRLCLIALVATMTLITGGNAWQRLPWLAPFLLILIGLVGSIAPTRMFLTIQPHVSNIIGQPVRLGPGVILNAIGHMLVSLIILWQWGWGTKEMPSQAGKAFRSSSRPAREAADR